MHPTDSLTLLHGKQAVTKMPEQPFDSTDTFSPEDIPPNTKDGMSAADYDAHRWLGDWDLDSSCARGEGRENLDCLCGYSRR